MGIWPTCAKEGCGRPAFFKVKLGEDGRESWAFLCVFCVVEIRKCLAALSGLSAEERKALDERAGPVPRIGRR